MIHDPAKDAEHEISLHQLHGYTRMVIPALRFDQWTETKAIWCVMPMLIEAGSRKGVSDAAIMSWRRALNEHFAEWLRQQAERDDRFGVGFIRGLVISSLLWGLGHIGLWLLEGMQ